MSTIKILSIKQPWSWLIVNGHKNIENRDWRYEPKFRGTFWVHAGKQIDKEAYMFYFQHFRDMPVIKDLELGGIVGQAEMVDCVRKSSSEWFEGPLGFVLIKAHTVPFHPLKGQLGFFNVPDYMCERCLGVMIGDDSGYCDKCNFQNGVEDE